MDHLLDAILADPEDDAPRLAYADRLDEQGDAEWAALIRLQVANAWPGPFATDAERAAVRAREERARPAVASRFGFAALRWRRGWPTRLNAEYSLPETFWPLLPTLRLVESLRVTTPGGFDAGRLLAGLLGLPLLASVEATLARDAPLTWDEVAPLAGLHRLTRLALTGTAGRWMLTAEVSVALDRERRARLAAVGEAERLAVARSYCRESHTDAAGGVWLTLDPGRGWPHQCLSVTAVPRLRGLDAGGNWSGVSSLPPGVRSLVGPEEAIRRELGEFFCTDDPVSDRADFSTLARLPRLRALGLPLPGESDIQLDELGDQKNLRVLHLYRPDPAAPRARVIDWLTLPELVELSARGTELPSPTEVRRHFPRLRYLGTDAPPDGPRRAEYAALGVLVTPVIGETPDIRLDWPRVDQGGVTLWREWGEEDGSDDDLLYGPARVRLERLPRPPEPSDVRRTLWDGPFAFPPERAEMATPTHLVARLPGGRVVERILRVADGEASRLTLEYPSRRAARFGHWLWAAAGTLS